MTPGLISRLQDIPGVDNVAIDLTGDAGAISLKVAPDADEKRILGEVQALLVSYGVRGLVKANIKVGRSTTDFGLDVSISPHEEGARIHVRAGDIESSRQVASTPKAIAQGLADAWCQVAAHPPLEVTAVTLGSAGALAIVVSDGTMERRGVADTSGGWANALTYAVGSALGLLGDSGTDHARLAPTAW